MTLPGSSIPTRPLRLAETIPLDVLRSPDRVAPRPLRP